MKTHPLEAVHIEAPRGYARVVQGHVFVGRLVELDGEVWILPVRHCDAYQAAQLISAADRVWLLGREAFSARHWRAEDNGSHTISIYVRPPRTWAEREQATAVASWA
ncbi:MULTISPECIES: hypothetical protein [Nocardia]|uniref:hypothetical protein n=1 Tax=Nocardia TaxID=1817 RepID=UPI000D69822B|nr:MULTISPECIES: hypothetical protein [Nocardia]